MKRASSILLVGLVLAGGAWLLQTRRRAPEAIVAGGDGPDSSSLHEPDIRRVTTSGRTAVDIATTQGDAAAATASRRADAEAEAGEEAAPGDSSAASLVEWYQVTDASGTPLEDALVVLRWTDDGTKTEIRGTPRADGYIKLTGCRPGLVWAEVSCPGYIKQTFPPEILPRPEPRTTQIVLHRAGRLTGRVRLDGEPVPDFVIVSWPASFVEDRVRLAVSGSEDGTFEFDGAPQGDIRVMAVSKAHGQSRVVDLNAPEGSIEHVELELARTGLGVGKVVDQVTGKPIDDATVQLFASDDGTPLEPIGVEIAVAADGAFELPAVSVQPSTLVVSAPHYSRQTRSAALAGNLIDFGTIALSPTQALEVRLVGDRSIDGASYAVRSFYGDLPAKRFSSEGIATYEEVSAGQLWLVVDLPDQTELYVDTALVAGGNWVVDVPIVTGHRLTLDVESADVDAPSGRVVVTYEGPGSVGYTRVVEEIPARLQVEGLLDTAISARVETDDGAVLGAATGSFVGAAELHLRIVLGENGCHLRVVDAGGKPVPSVGVNLGLQGNPDSIVHGATNERGECTFLGLPEGQLYAQLYHPERGAAIGLPVTRSGDPDEVIELVFAPSASLRLRVTNHDDPVVGVSCYLGDPNLSYRPESPVLTTDADGLAAWDRISDSSYLVLLRHPDYFPLNTTLRASEETHDLRVRRRGDLDLQVFDAAGAPMIGARVALRSVEDGVDVTSWDAKTWIDLPEMATDNLGRLRIGGLPEGAFRWQIASVDGLVRVDPDHPAVQSLVVDG